MHQTGVRRERLAAAIRETLSQLILRDMKDPRLDGVVISAVELSRDLKQARAFFSVIGDEERERQAADGLAQARGLLRREVGRSLRLRATPELEFKRDLGFERADRVQRILGSLSYAETPPDEDGEDTSEQDPQGPGPEERPGE